VWMPLDFLRDAEMAEKGLQVNSWTESVYTWLVFWGYEGWVGRIVRS
jgi:hypothetical protein